MNGTPPEDLLEWLEREEEVLGVDATVRASEDMEVARKLLYNELGYGPSDLQVSSFMDAGAIRYEQLPMLGVRHTMVEHWWGFQSSYRDIITGRFVASADVMSALRTFF